MKSIISLFFVLFSVIVFTGCSVNSKKEKAETVAIQAFNKMYVTIPGDTCGAKLIASKSEVTDWEKFSMFKDEANMLSFRGFNNSFVCANLANWGFLIADKRNASDWEKYVLVELGGNKVALKTTYGKYVSADPSKGFLLIADKDSVGETEKFTLVKNP